MAARYSLMIGLGALIGVGWLLPMGLPPNRLLSVHAHGHPIGDAGLRLGEAKMDAPKYSPFERKLRRNGFQPHGEADLLNEVMTFQDVCDLLECKVEDFEPPQWGLYPPLRVVDYDTLYAAILRRKDFTCYVWVFNPDCWKDKDKLRKAGVRVSVWIHR